MPHITFIHGIANKPPADRLLQSWERALAANGVWANGMALQGVYAGADVGKRRQEHVGVVCPSP